MEDCLICNEPLGEKDVILVQKKRVQSLLKASIERGERQHERMLFGVDSLRVHNSCQKKNTDARHIKAALRRRSQSETPLPSPSSECPSSSTSSSQPCDLEGPADPTPKCLICNEQISADWLAKNAKKRRDLRETVHSVWNFAKIKKSLLGFLAQREDDHAKEVIERINNIPEDPDNLKYHKSCFVDLKNPAPRNITRGPKCEQIDDIIQGLINIMSASEDCQFKLSELLKLVNSENVYDIRTIKKHLVQKHSDDVVIVDCHGQDAFVLYKSTGYRALSDNWYKEKNPNVEEERKRIVKEAAAIILQDIRSVFSDNENYPPSDKFLDNVQAQIPDTQRLFLKEIVMKLKRGSAEKWERIVTSIAHAIMAAARPRNFLSSLQMGIGTFLFKKTGSRHLLDFLSSFGFSASYHDISQFELASIQSQQPTISPEGFCQFVFDNVDWNINTIDGHSTFHAMGGIITVTPKDAIASNKEMPRKFTKLTPSQLGRFGVVPIETYEKSYGDKELIIADVNGIHPIDLNILPTMQDFLWLYGKWAMAPNIPGWNGFMEEATTERNFSVSKILCMPFINAPPSDYDTLYTTLRLAIEKSETLQQESCIVTFDLPLFVKAHEIIFCANPDSPLKKIILRLGGFHLLMSFLGSIGNIMNGSGLNELLETIFAPNTVRTIMTGHAYSRAVRGHLLIHQALAKLVMDNSDFPELDFSDDERDVLDAIVENIDRSAIYRESDLFGARTAYSKFTAKVTKMEEQGPTAKLWIVYFRMVTLVKHFIEAERSGNWHLHLDTIQKMLPYFHASGHFPYAKAAHLYLQEMMNLSTKMPQEEFEKFTGGLHSIRRSAKFWAGISTDMTIEQVLMRLLKTDGGITIPGRGISDVVLTRWALGMYSTMNVCDEVEKYSGVFSATSEQHTDARDSRITLDNTHSQKINDWLSEHYPFSEDRNLRSISSGVVGDSTINCHLSYEIGSQMMERIIGKNYFTLSLRRKDKVHSLAEISNGLLIDPEQPKVIINPNLLIQRISVSKQTTADLILFLTYELSPCPLSLFTPGQMRHGTKSKLYQCFTPLSKVPDFKTRPAFVVDGGFLLHRVVWDNNLTYSEICQKYVHYIEKHYGLSSTVVFDGYPDDLATLGTKCSERFRRNQAQRSADIIITETMASTTKQEKFLSNERNKTRFINMLTKILRQSGITVEQAVEDADKLIVDTALGLTREYSSIVIVGEDVDLLVLLTVLGNKHTNIFFWKPGRGRVADLYFTSTSLAKKYSSMKDIQNLLVLHAFSGCDTTSAPYNIGKSKVITTLGKQKHLTNIVKVFTKRKKQPVEVEQAGKNIFIALYGGNPNETTLNYLRYRNYVRLSTKSRINLASLPPTEDAAKYHSYRTYQQVQAWLGNYLDPEEWGWTRTPQGLQPIASTMPVAPASLLECISCKCRTGCGRACGCRKAGLNCTLLCENCTEETCTNQQKVIINDPEWCGDDEDIVDHSNDKFIETLQSAYSTEEDNEEVEEHVIDVECLPSAKRQRVDEDI